ncbi:MAG: GyrI-like domain-containing protein [Methanomassiliicoccaceae archaeon]|jgi:effector-binding domain-containing protein|nr:GyrI-like domain-containing protein [Methanomassiliicoccaceae archaeon]
MPRVTDIMIMGQTEQDTLTVRTRTKVTDLPRLVGQVYPKLFAYLAELGEIPMDMPFITYYNMDMNDLDVEVGVPVSKTLPPRGEMAAGRIPEGKAVVCMFRGSYADTESTYNEMWKWAADNNLRPAGTAREHYFNDPMSFPESELLTKIVLTLSDR